MLKNLSNATFSLFWDSVLYLKVLFLAFYPFVFNVNAAATCSACSASQWVLLSLLVNLFFINNFSTQQQFQGSVKAYNLYLHYLLLPLFSSS